MFLLVQINVSLYCNCVVGLLLFDKYVLQIKTTFNSFKAGEDTGS